MFCQIKNSENVTKHRRLLSTFIKTPSLVGGRGLGRGYRDERCRMHYRVTRRSNFIHDLFFCLGLQFIAVKRNPDVLNTSGATSTSASQSSGESSTSQDKGIRGPKFIALAAENSNLKNLLAEVRHQSVFSRRGGGV